MRFRIDYSSQAIRYIRQNNLQDKIRNAIARSVHYLQGNLSKYHDIKKLSGKWEGYYRIRSGRLRIIIKLELCKKHIYVKRIGDRKDVYR